MIQKASPRAVRGRIVLGASRMIRVFDRILALRLLPRLDVAAGFVMRAPADRVTLVRPRRGARLRKQPRFLSPSPLAPASDPR